MKFINFNRFIFPFFLLFICILVYGIFTPFMGFYWDDFPYTWFKVVNGVQGTISAISLDRPMLALFYMLPMSILGDKPLAWQLFAIITRWVYTLSMYGFLQSLWPNRKHSNQNLTLLLSVFPGFTQQWISVIYSHAFLIFSLYFLSLIVFISNLKAEHSSIINTFISIILAIVSMSATEYVVGLELIRPLIIFINERRKGKTRVTYDLIKSTFIKWLPYLFGLLLFIAYRVFFASSVLYKIQNLNDFLFTPVSTTWGLFTAQIKNIYTSIIPVWGVIFFPFSLINLSSRYWKFHLGFIVILLLFSALFLFFQKKEQIHDQAPPDNQWIKESIPLSFYILIFAGVPFWAANLEPSVDFPHDRFLLPFMLGSTLAIFIFLELFRKKKLIWSILFCALFSLSGTYQLYQANNYRNEWDNFTQFFQQTSWRIPSLDSNTILVTDKLPFIYYSDNSLTAALNWLYAKDITGLQLPYMLNYTDVRLGTSLPSLEPGTKIHQDYRIFSFNSSTDRMIIFYHQPPGCVHIADPALDPLNPLVPGILREAARLSNDVLILPEINRNDVFFVEEEPQASWCFYYQKASLAYQLRDWETIAHLGDSAFSINDYPNDASERIPFIFGYAHTEQWEKALQLTQITYQVSNLYQPMLCEAWKIIDEGTSDDYHKENTLAIIEGQLACKFLISD